MPLLYSLVFGESVLNDAVAIALVSALTPYVGTQLKAITVGYVVRDFIIILLGSIAVGFVVGMFAAFVCLQSFLILFYSL